MSVPPPVPEPPPPIAATAILVLPAGTVKLPEAVNVCDSAYAGTAGVTLAEADDADAAIPDADAVTVNV
jgi:hypothetical protein